MNIIVTGGAGFIGSNLINFLIKNTECNVLNLDKLSYSGNLISLDNVSSNPRYSFVHADICDHDKVNKIFTSFQPDIIMHLAAESHVDRSIDSPFEFINTNIIGTYILLESSRKYYGGLSKRKKLDFKFHHISTDEVYGDLEKTSDLFTESSSYRPNSPYSATKASSDHLVRAWSSTYKLPILITNCSNNYGPYQFPEKLIPLVILNALDGKHIPIYGQGDQIRDWLYVEDHVKALYEVAVNAKPGITYNIGGLNEKKNIEVVRSICNILDNTIPLKNGKYKSLIKYVDDRPGHDKRYAIDSSKIKKELKWEPEETFETGLRKTVKWYLDNREWCNEVDKNVPGLRDRKGKT